MKVTSSLFAHAIIHQEKVWKLTRTLHNTKRELSTLTDHKVNSQKSIAFTYVKKQLRKNIG